MVDAPPVAAIAVRTARRLPSRPISFSGALSRADNPIVSYLWHFPGGGDAVGRNVTHAFARDGVYRVALTVCDSFGTTAMATLMLSVGREVHPAPARRPRRHRRKR